MAKVKKYEDVLMTAFYFDAQDLEANQAGKLTDWQRNRLKADIRRSTSALAIIGFGGVFVFAAGASVFVSSPHTPAESLLPLVLIVLMIAAFAAAYYYLRSQHASADLSQQQVGTVEGRVELKAASSGERSSAYSARVGSIQFPLKQHEFLAFKNGDPYRIYYAPQSHRILSLEWLRESEDDNLIETPADADSLADSDTASKSAS